MGVNPFHLLKNCEFLAWHFLCDIWLLHCQQTDYLLLLDSQQFLLDCLNNLPVQVKLLPLAEMLLVDQWRLLPI